MKIINIIVQACLILCLCMCQKEELPIESQIRTVVVYMAADNDLSADAWADIREMQSGFEEKGINLIVFIDP